MKAYERFASDPGFACVATREEVRAKEGNLSIPLYVPAHVSEAREKGAEYRVEALPAALDAWRESSGQVRRSLETLLAGSPSKTGDH